MNIGSPTAARMEEIDIWRAAQQLIKMYWSEAGLAAAQRADKAIDQGDPEGERVWVRITRAVAELSRQTPSGGEELN